MAAQPQPTTDAPDPATILQRLEDLGVTVTRSTAGGRRAFHLREPVRVHGEPLSTTLVRMRDEERGGH
jgi:hypothetical protein